MEWWNTKWLVQQEQCWNRSLRSLTHSLKSYLDKKPSRSCLETSVTYKYHSCFSQLLLFVQKWRHCLSRIEVIAESDNMQLQALHFDRYRIASALWFHGCIQIRLLVKRFITGNIFAQKDVIKQNMRCPLLIITVGWVFRLNMPGLVPRKATKIFSDNKVVIQRVERIVEDVTMISNGPHLQCEQLLVKLQGYRLYRGCVSSMLQV